MILLISSFTEILWPWQWRGLCLCPWGLHLGQTDKVCIINQSIKMITDDISCVNQVVCRKVSWDGIRGTLLYTDGQERSWMMRRSGQVKRRGQHSRHADQSAQWPWDQDGLNYVLRVIENCAEEYWSVLFVSLFLFFCYFVIRIILLVVYKINFWGWKTDKSRSRETN